MATKAPSRPKRAASIAQIRTMGYQGETQRQVTNGWYARGEKGPDGEWRPVPGLPDEVFVLLPMGAPYEREMYPDKGFRPLSNVPNKKAIAGRNGRGNPEFAIDPPDIDELRDVMEMLRERIPDAKAILEEQLADIDEALEDSGALTKGEAPQLRQSRKKLQARLKRLDDPKEFQAEPFYRAFVKERQGVIRAQMDPAVVRQSDLEREYREWDSHLEELHEEAPAREASQAST